MIGAAAALELPVQGVDPGGGQRRERHGADVRRQVQPDILAVAGHRRGRQAQAREPLVKVGAYLLLARVDQLAPVRGDQHRAQRPLRVPLGRPPLAVRPGPPG